VVQHVILSFFLPLVLAQQPPGDQGFLIHDVSKSHRTTHHIRCDSCGRVINPSQRPLPDITQHSQQTDIIHVTHNLSRRAATVTGSCIFTSKTRTYTITYMCYQHSAACFGVYFRKVQWEIVVCSNLFLRCTIADLKLFCYGFTSLIYSYLKTILLGPVAQSV